MLANISIHSCGPSLTRSTSATASLAPGSLKSSSSSIVGGAEVEDLDPVTRLSARTQYGRPDFGALFGAIRTGIENGSYLPGRESTLKTTVGGTSPPVLSSLPAGSGGIKLFQGTAADPSPSSICPPSSRPSSVLLPLLSFSLPPFTVFYCGPNPLAKSLRERTKEASKGGNGSVAFQFSKEHF
jgi:hypothetical protein